MAKTIEEILPYYLGTGLKFRHFDETREIIEVCQIAEWRNDEVTLLSNMHQYEVWTKDLTPMLRFLSRLTELITVEGYNDGKPFVPIHEMLAEYCFDVSKMDEEDILSYSESMVEVDMSFQTAQLLFKWHFNIFNLRPGQFVEIEDKQSILNLREEV